VTSPLYEQQGKPLDSILVVKGWWVEYGHVSLFVPPFDQDFTPPQQLFRLQCHKLSDAFTVVGSFHVSTRELLLNNQIGGLSVRGEPGVPTPGATHAGDVIFGLPYGAEVRAPVKRTDCGVCGTRTDERKSHTPIAITILNHESTDTIEECQALRSPEGTRLSTHRAEVLYS